MAAASALMKNAAGYLILMVVGQALLITHLVNGIAPPQTALWHHQRIAVLHSGMLSAVFLAASLAFIVRGRLSTAAKDARPPMTRMLRASLLLAVALSLAATVLAAVTMLDVLQVRMATVFSCLSGAAKAGFWASCVVAGLGCAFWHYRLAALAIWSE